MAGIYIFMKHFNEYLAYRDVATLLRLLESADYFDPQQYNIAFTRGLDELLDRIHDPAAREQIEANRNFDWANYIVRSLQRAGFKGDDLQEHFHNLVVRMLVNPGNLFKGWNPERNGPINKRFRRSIWNGIRNVATLSRNHRRRMTSTDPVMMADRFAGKQPPHSSALIDQFRRLVASALGTMAATILDWRLDGKDIKDLIGNPDFGFPTGYVIKREVKLIKQTALQYASQTGDPAFITNLQKAMNAEQSTVAKRQQAMAGRQAVKSV